MSRQGVLAEGKGFERSVRCRRFGELHAEDADFSGRELSGGLRLQRRTMIP